MKEAKVCVRTRKKFKVTTDSKHSKPIFDNVLDRQFDVSEADLAYVGDITYIWTQQGWLYLAVVIDLFSRKVVGWSLQNYMKSSLVCEALTMAIMNRKPGKGLLCHTDRGSQYASDQYRDLLKEHGFVGSMSRRANCWDNSVAESFFGSLKRERVQWKNYKTRQDARADIVSYIAMFYNATRLHSYLDYVSPNSYEQQFSETRIAA
jgi:putative transposase